jgi:Mlc titration factor MtfA (ptsG expression regulator)
MLYFFNRQPREMDCMEALLTRRNRINLVFSAAVSFLAVLSLFMIFLLLFRPASIEIRLVSAAGALAPATALFLFLRRRFRRRRRILSDPFPEAWKKILHRHVSFYRNLAEDERGYFEKRVRIFLAEKKITGVEVKIGDLERLLVASAALIPVFRIADWEYDSLDEVLLYPRGFDDEYDFSSGRGDVLGMVADHTSAVILSARELRGDFRTGKWHNTAIHEFLHRIDEEDGVMDGVPSLLLDREHAAMWKAMRQRETRRMESGESPLDPYALTDEAEFFAVAGETFFSDPGLLEKGSPALYDIMRLIFRQDPAASRKRKR